MIGMGAVPDAVSVGAFFWPIFSLGFLCGLAGGLVLAFIVIAALKRRYDHKDR